MNYARYLIIAILVLLRPWSINAAPVGNIGDEALWTSGILSKGFKFPFITSIIIDRQTNDLPVQVNRFNWTDPSVSPLEERTYSQTRWSRYTLDSLGLKIGIPVNDMTCIYGIVGDCNTMIDLHYEDWTVSRVFKRNDSFSSENDFFYGIGATIIMQRIDYAKIPLTIGMDIKYRHFENSSDKLSSNLTAYSSTLDEVQIAVSLSAKLEYLSPYIGWKVANLTGHETYIDQNDFTSYFSEGYVHYSNAIVTSRNIGYCVGATKYISRLFSVGFEVRFGDERGLGINTTTRF